MTDKEKFLNKAQTLIGKNGYYVCITELGLGAVYDWCAFSVTLIMKLCGFLGKYVKGIEGGAGQIPRDADGKYGTWFRKGSKAPAPGDLFFLRYDNYPNRDKYFCDHVGIVKSVSGNKIITLEGNVDGRGADWAGTSSFKSKTRSLTDSSMYAFYRPNWKNEGTSQSGSASAGKTTNEIAREVIRGKWGVGAERKTKLTAAGYSYSEVQSKVNELMKSGTSSAAGKTVEALAREVIAGKWGCGADRCNRLTAAGYDYNSVQRRVNEILR